MGGGDYNAATTVHTPCWSLGRSNGKIGVSLKTFTHLHKGFKDCSGNMYLRVYNVKKFTISLSFFLLLKYRGD